jgi:hypothetical protein
MMCFSLDYLLRQVVVSGKENAVDARAARLNNRNAEPEGCNFQRDRFETAYRPSSRPPLAAPAACAMRSKCGMWVLRRARGLRPRLLTPIWAHPEERLKLGKRRSGGGTKHRLEEGDVGEFLPRRSCGHLCPEVA